MVAALTLISGLHRAQDHTSDCIKSPFQAIAELNSVEGEEGGEGWTRTAQGCDLFFAENATGGLKNGFAEALALAKEADYIVLGLGIDTCGFNASHSPGHGGKCYQEKLTTGYTFPE